MTTSTRLTGKNQLIKQAFDEFFYKARVNIGLEKAMKEASYKKFEALIYDAIKKQVEQYAKIDKINRIVGVQKAVQELTEVELLDRVLLFWLPLSQFINEEEINSFLRDMAQIGGATGASKAKYDGAFFLKDQVILKNLSIQAKALIDQIEKTTQSWVARTIEQGLRDKISHVQIAKIFRDNAEKYAAERASLIAENEAATAIAETEYEFFKRNGIESHQWITARDEQVCSICMGNESIGIIRVGTLFPSGTLMPPAHLRCRCFIKPVVPEGMKITWTG